MSRTLQDIERKILLALNDGAEMILQSGVQSFCCVVLHQGDRQQYNRASYVWLRDKGLVKRSDNNRVVLTPLGSAFARNIVRNMESAA